MVLLIQNESIKASDASDLLDKILANKFVQEKAMELQKMKTQLIDPVQYGKNLYVFQRERATVKKNQVIITQSNKSR